MSKPKSRKMTPPSTEPIPQQLYLSDESEEGKEEDESVEGEAEVDKAEDPFVQPKLQISFPLRKKSKRYQLSAGQLD